MQFRTETDGGQSHLRSFVCVFSGKKPIVPPQAFDVGRTGETLAGAFQISGCFLTRDRQSRGGAHAERMIKMPVCQNGKIGRAEPAGFQRRIKSPRVAPRISRVDGERVSVAAHVRQQGAVRFRFVRAVKNFVRQFYQFHGSSVGRGRPSSIFRVRPGDRRRGRGR